MLKRLSALSTKVAICFFSRKRVPLRSTPSNSPKRKPATLRSTRFPRRTAPMQSKKGHLDVLVFPDFFPNQGGLPSYCSWTARPSAVLLPLAPNLRLMKPSHKQHSTLFSTRSNQDQLSSSLQRASEMIRGNA